MRSLFLPIALVWTLCPTANGQTVYEVLVNSRGTHAVHRYDATGNFLGEFITAGSGGLNSPEQVLFHPDGSALVTGAGNTEIKRYDGITGNYLGNFSSGFTLNVPSKMSIGPDSLIYVTQWGGPQDKVVRFDLDGVFVDEFTSIATPNGLGHFWDAQGRFYLSVYGNGASGTVQRFAPDGTFIDVFIDSSILQGPTDLWQETNGDVLVQDWTSGTVLRFDSSGAFISTFISGLSNPEGHAFLPPGGDLLMGDWGEDAVHRHDNAGNDLGYFTSGNGLADPNGVYVRAVPFASVAERGIAATLLALPTAGAGPFTLQMPYAADASTTLLVLDATGRIVDQHALVSGVQRWHWSPPGSLATGRYRLVIGGATTVAQTTVVVQR